ncbi:hypothetical protein SFRURICE_019166 [Spodoptera frugiperda]|nr:hypothetical protein SFRURICE_019166 [Spodoptera frugiperda]
MSEFGSNQQQLFIYRVLCKFLHLLKFIRVKVSVHRPASYASHATDFSLSCIETNASTNPHRTDRIIGNAYMRCAPMTSYGIRTMRAMRTMRACGRLPYLNFLITL